MYDKTIYDYQATLLRVGNNQEIAREILLLMIQEMPQLRVELLQAIKQKDDNALDRVLHKLKGGLAYCVAPQLLAALAALKAQIKAKQFNFRLEEIQEILTAMDAFVEHISTKDGNLMKN